MAIGSRSAPLVASFLLGLLVGAALTGVFTGGGTSEDLGRARSSADAPSLVGADAESAPALARAARRPDADVAVEESRTAERDPHDEEGASFASVEAGRIEVRGAFADGTPVREGIAYALPARAPGVDHPEDCAHARLEDRAIPIEAPGLYDVGLRAGELVASKTDVRVVAGETARVDLVLPPAVPVRVRAEANDLAWDGVHGWVSLRSADDGAVWYPGRGGVALVQAGVQVVGPGEVASAPLPLGTRLRVSAGAEEEFVDPVQSKAHGVPIRAKRPHSTVTLVPSEDTVAPGERVSVSLAESAVLDVRVLTTPREAALEGITFRARAGGRDLPVSTWGISESGRQRLHVRVVVTAGEVHLAWSGPRVQEGETRFDVPKGGRVEREVEVRVRDESWVPVVLTGLRPSASAGLELYLARTAEAEDVEIDVRTFDLGGEDPLRVPSAWRGGVVVGADGENSVGSVGVVVPRSGPLEIALRPAGAVVVVLDRDVDPNAGPLTVSTADGRPLLTDRQFRRLGALARVEAGTRIACLPEGDHVFHVRMNGVPLPDAKVRVVAGRIVPLRIGR